MKAKKTKRAGFTLIELLVVIAIIGVLSTIVMVSVNDLRARARDDRRVSDMKAIRDALAMYQVQHMTYPSLPTETAITGTDALSTELLGEKELTVMPLDPLNAGGYTYSYQSLSNDSTYVLKFCLETDSLRSYAKGCGNQVGP